MSDFEVQGLADLEKQLAKFGKELASKRLRSALRESAKPIQEAAKRNVPEAERSYWSRQKGGGYKRVAPGRLKRSIKTRTIVKPGIVWAFVGARAVGKSKDVFYQNFVEFGTRPHRMKRGRHPGAEAQPFLRPAYKANEASFLEMFKQKIKRKIDLLARQRARGKI